MGNPFKPGKPPYKGHESMCPCKTHGSPGSSAGQSKVTGGRRIGPSSATDPHGGKSKKKGSE